MRRALLLAALATACVSGGTRRPQRWFVLEPPAAAPAGLSVRVAPVTAASFYDTQDIAFSRAPGTRAFYQFNRFTDRPQRALEAALAARLDAGAANTALVLQANVDEIFHDAAQPPGVARIAITARLVDAHGVVLATRRFARSAPATSFDADGAVHGFAIAAGAIADDVVAWIASAQRLHSSRADEE